MSGEQPMCQFRKEHVWTLQTLYKRAELAGLADGSHKDQPPLPPR